jgi:integrase
MAATLGPAKPEITLVIAGTICFPTLAHTGKGIDCKLSNSWWMGTRSCPGATNPRDPTKGVPGFRKPRSPRSGRYLRPDQLRTFLGLVEEHWGEHHALTVVLASYGLRWGEGSALRLQDVDWEAGEIRVAQSHVRGKVTATKTDSVRLLPLTEPVREVLQEHLARLREMEHPGLVRGLLFPTRDGGYRTPSSVARAWRDVSKRMGHPWEIRPHDLRRTCQNLLRLAGAGLVVQQAVLGHSSDAMTTHYSHVAMAEKRVGLDNVFSLIGYRSKKTKDRDDEVEENS